MAVGLPGARLATRTGADRTEPTFPTLVAILVLVGFLLLGGALYSAQFSRTAQWIAGVAFVGLLALVGMYVVVRRTKRPAPLAPAPRVGEIHEGHLSSLAGIADRAFRGMAFSQTLIVARARDAFAERVRLQRGLSAEGMRALEEDPAGLRSAVEDPDLVTFLRETRDRDGREAWALRARERDGFEAAIQAVLGRMEAWR